MRYKSTRILPFLIILSLLAALYFYEIRHYSRSVTDALNNKAGSQLKEFIGGDIKANEAYLFYLDLDNQVVGTFLKKNMFGWKVRGAQTGTGLEVNKRYTLTKASVGSRYAQKKFYFGLTSIDNLGKLVINEKYRATLIDLDQQLQYPDETRNKFLWYVYFTEKSNDNDYKVQVYDKQNNQIYP
ncbi:hypothetical protein DUZ99_14485 [Xylanibacillus composti]|uniref:Uncharacterized protein n=1 Tax=Xylanibacillus composti TaxID=1572762 RepID=A0A8J4M210_9BACL|nr:hypothetical protein [Xylanibacillus composti]MDT9726185.1 hypothetical protein [Xylanibacillus composti]GIQ68031.1 hypothetical protein XYCOK13_08550 [Xylanibacillus composti]